MCAAQVLVATFSLCAIGNKQANVLWICAFYSFTTVLPLFFQKKDKGVFC